MPSVSTTNLIALMAVLLVGLAIPLHVWTAAILRRKGYTLGLMVPFIMLTPLPVGIIIAFMLRPHDVQCPCCGRSVLRGALECSHCGAAINSDPAAGD